MVRLEEIVAFLNSTFNVEDAEDFSNAFNGLQLANDGCVHRVMGAVDANPASIELAINNKADLLCVHHGLYWNGVQPMVGSVYDLFRKAMEANLAIYSLHLPLDSHPKWGHNTSIAHRLGLKESGYFCNYFQQNCGILCEGSGETTETLGQRIKDLFPCGHQALLYGPRQLSKIGIVSGSGGQDLLDEMVKCHIDTLITGEIRYSALSFAQLHHLNIFACGHYATECFGVRNLLTLVSEQFSLPCEFLDFEGVSL
jgi:Uncharacterized conserved protein